MNAEEVNVSHKKQQTGEQADSLKTLTEAVLEALEDKKALDILVIDVRGRCDFADRFVLATGRSDRQIKALSQSLVEVAHSFGLPGKVEGLDAMEWLLVDLGDIIIHLFLPEVRESFQLEKLWGQPGAIASA